MVATVIALTGNMEVARPWEHDFSIFGWVEAAAPPLLVLWCGHVLTGQILTILEERGESKKRYEQALDKWNELKLNPESSPSWMRIYAASLKDALRRANKKLTYIVLDSLDEKTWGRLVYNELSQDRLMTKTIEFLQENEKGLEYTINQEEAVVPDIGPLSS